MRVAMATIINLVAVDHANADILALGLHLKEMGIQAHYTLLR